MGFNFGGFLAGASQQIVKSIEEKEEEIREEERLASERKFQREMMERRASLSAGTAAASDRRRRNQEIEDLTSRAAFLYGKDNAASMATEGFGYLTEAVALGNQLNAAGFSAREFYTAGGNTLDTAKRVQTNIKTTDATTAAIPTADAPSAPAPVAGFDFAGIRKALKPNKTASSLDALLAMNTQDIMEANNKNDTDALNAALQNQATILKTIALTEDQDAVEQILENPQSLYESMRAQAIGDRGKEAGEFGQLIEEVEGSPYFGALMNYDAANRMFNFGSELEPEQAFNLNAVATGIQKAAEIELLDFADDKANTFLATERGASDTGETDDPTIQYFKLDKPMVPEKLFGKWANNFAKKGPPASVIIVKDNNNNIRVALYTGVPNKKLGGAPYIIQDR